MMSSILKKLIMFTLCMNLLPFYILAQSGKWKAGGIAEAALLLGASEPSADVRAMFTMRRQAWTLAAGAGIDWYGFRSVPLLVQGRYHVGGKKVRPFVQASAGWNIAAVNHKNQTWQATSMPPGFIGIWPPMTLVDNEYRGGYYADLGAGASFFNRRGRGLSLGLALQRKTMTESWQQAKWVEGGTQVFPESLHWTMDRLAFRLGWQF